MHSILLLYSVSLHLSDNRDLQFRQSSHSGGLEGHTNYQMPPADPNLATRWSEFPTYYSMTSSVATHRHNYAVSVEGFHSG